VIRRSPEQVDEPLTSRVFGDLSQMHFRVLALRHAPPMVFVADQPFRGAVDVEFSERLADDEHALSAERIVEANEPMTARWHEVGIKSATPSSDRSYVVFLGEPNPHAGADHRSHQIGIHGPAPLHSLAVYAGR
jgi:hypothetical protein